MAPVDRIRRQQILREAEGYLEFVDLFGERWEPSAVARDALAQRSLSLLERLPRSIAGSVPVLYLRGRALKIMGQFGAALGPLEKAATIEPGNLHVQLSLGWCYKRTGQIARAIDALETARDTHPDEAVLPYNLACYLSLAGKRRKAIAYLSEALAMDDQYRSLIDGESDFDPIRSDPDFQSLLSVIV